MDSRDAVILGALLHDVGKFYQRTMEGNRTPHEVWGKRFFEEYIPARWQDAKTLVLKHHDPGYDELAEIVQCADRISAGMERIGRDPEERGDPSKDRLSAILERVSIEQNNKRHFEYKFYLEALSTDKSLFPFKEENRGKLTAEYSKLWNGFVKELSLLKQEDFEAFFTSLYYLLEKYTWCVPSATYVSEPDISLFDHSKTTAAIAACLYDTKNQDRFLLVEGDLSGIQGFIYQMENPQEAQEGMSKRLRGKSFYLSLLNETLGTYLLRRLNLPICNLLWCGGGHFAILAPNTDDKLQTIHDFDVYANEWLYKTFQTDLALNVGVVKADREGLKNFSDVLHQMSLELTKLKQKKFIQVRHKRIFPLGKNVCPVCGRDISHQEPTLCELCRLFEKIGGYLPKLDALVRIENRRVSGENYVCFNEFGISWGLGKKAIPPDGKFTAFSLDPSNFLGSDGFAYGFKMIANEVFTDKKGDPFEFDKLAEQSEGAEYLGVLRMDVDDLGAVFSIGLGTDNSISRVATLSRSLDYFFSGYLNRLCEGKYLYVTYAGGDDLFIVGAWNEIVALSQKISSEFQRYACYNPDMHLSGGIHLCRKKFPISRGAILSGQKLSRAKEKFPSKNAVYLFEQIVHWDKMEEVIDAGEYIIKNMNLNSDKGVISRRFVYQLLGLYKQHIAEDKQEIRWLPKFLYLITRDVKDQQVRSELQRRVSQLAHQIPMLTSYVALKTRRRT